ncbi:uncharacterized protein LOC125661544 isoform X3 [Ostrea edulis]|uniref:uncharacterized protein LOC125661544 isoform X3 n=1 Tax=Ostrea edulis TaxID=37623 RepID=UPI0024AF0454|nr:uncharacterized protein LOC125661544 isoform X3 [Ostrea edulis]
MKSVDLVLLLFCFLQGESWPHRYEHDVRWQKTTQVAPSTPPPDQSHLGKRVEPASEFSSMEFERHATFVKTEVEDFDPGPPSSKKAKEAEHSPSEEPFESNVGTEESEVVRIKEETESLTSDHESQDVSLHLEVEDGAESIDDDSSGESDSDTESGEEVCIKEEEDPFDILFNMEVTTRDGNLYMMPISESREDNSVTTTEAENDNDACLSQIPRLGEFEENYSECLRNSEVDADRTELSKVQSTEDERKASLLRLLSNPTFTQANQQLKLLIGDSTKAGTKKKGRRMVRRPIATQTIKELKNLLEKRTVTQADGCFTNLKTSKSNRVMRSMNRNSSDLNRPTVGTTGPTVSAVLASRTTSSPASEPPSNAADSQQTVKRDSNEKQATLNLTLTINPVTGKLMLVKSEDVAVDGNLKSTNADSMRQLSLALVSNSETRKVRESSEAMSKREQTLIANSSREESSLVKSPTTSEDGFSRLSPSEASVTSDPKVEVIVKHDVASRSSINSTLGSDPPTGNSKLSTSSQSFNSDCVNQSSVNLSVPSDPKAVEPSSEATGCESFNQSPLDLTIPDSVTKTSTVVQSPDKTKDRENFSRDPIIQKSVLVTSPNRTNESKSQSFEGLDPATETSQGAVSGTADTVSDQAGDSRTQMSGAPAGTGSKLIHKNNKPARSRTQHSQHKLGPSSKTDTLSHRGQVKTTPVLQNAGNAVQGAGSGETIERPPSKTVKGKRDEKLAHLFTTPKDMTVWGMNIFQDEMNNGLEDGNPSRTCDSKEGKSASKRFGEVSDEELIKYYEGNQSSSTRKNTRWGLKVFQEWCLETQEEAVDFSSINSQDLATLLTKFYCEAKPKPLNSRQNAFTAEAAGEYHKNTLKNIRGAINRHLQDLGRNIDIVNDKEFRATNRTLKGLLKLRMQERLSRPSLQDDVISEEDLKSIFAYFKNAESHPVLLRQCVWFNLAIHFVTRVTEFHPQLKINSFLFKSDETGEYAVLLHEIKQKNAQGGSNGEDVLSDKRMYATQTRQCPVKMLKLLIEKTDKNADSLFNQYNKPAVEYPTLESTWYINKPLAKRSFANFLSDICKYAKTSKIYAPHCLRTTAIRHTNNIGHHTEASVTSDKRHGSTEQKKTLGSTLPKVTVMEDDNSPPARCPDPEADILAQCPAPEADTPAQCLAPEVDTPTDSCSVQLSMKTPVGSTSGDCSSAVAKETNSDPIKNDD